MLECYELKENEFPSQVHGHIRQMEECNVCNCFTRHLLINMQTDDLSEYVSVTIPVHEHKFLTVHVPKSQLCKKNEFLDIS